MGHLTGVVCYFNLSITKGFVDNFPSVPFIRFSADFAFLRSSPPQEAAAAQLVQAVQNGSSTQTHRAPSEIPSGGAANA